MFADTASDGLYYGLDIGGSKIEMIACNPQLQVCHRQRIDTPHTGYADFLEAICTLVANADAATGRRSGRSAERRGRHADLQYSWKSKHHPGRRGRQRRCCACGL